MVKRTLLKQDNMEIIYDFINQIRDWFLREHITEEDAFRVFDKNYNGYLKQSDLKYFMQNILKVT